MRNRFYRFCHDLLHKKYMWTILIFIVIAGFVDSNSFWHRYQIRKQNEALRQEIASYQAQYKADTRELNDIEHNPDAVERVARVNLYMKTADEDVYVVEGDTLQNQ